MNKRARAIAVTTIIFAALVYLFAWSPVFTVRSIQTEGLPTSISSQSIISKSKIHLGSQLSRIEPRSAGRSLREISWVKEVSISRNWINGKVTISITPRTPVGLYNGKAIDKSGEIFILPGSIPTGLPVVSAATPELGLVAISLFTNLPADVRDGLTSISAASENSISSWQIWNGRGLRVTWGNEKQLELKVSVLKALLQQPENKSITRADLSAPHAPIVK